MTIKDISIISACGFIASSFFLQSCAAQRDRKAYYDQVTGLSRIVQEAKTTDAQHLKALGDISQKLALSAANVESLKNNIAGIKVPTVNQIGAVVDDKTKPCEDRLKISFDAFQLCSQQSQKQEGLILMLTDQSKLWKAKTDELAAAWDDTKHQRDEALTGLEKANAMLARASRRWALVLGPQAGINSTGQGYVGLGATFGWRVL